MTEANRDEHRCHWQFEAVLLKAILGVLTAVVIGGVAWVLTISVPVAVTLAPKPFRAAPR